MDLTKTPRKRVPNFTADEKVLLAQIIKKRSIVESKLTDGTSIAKKQAAWDLITQEFNCNANVHKRETIVLKRAWDNMKAFTRKARAEQRGNLLRTGGGPHAPLTPPQHGGLMSMVEEAAPAIICEIKNGFDSDGAILDAIDNNQDQDFVIDDNSNKQTSVLIDTIDILNTNKKFDSEELTNFEVQDIFGTNSPQIVDAQKSSGKNSAPVIKTTELLRRPTDYVRREAVIRIKHLENKKKMEMHILRTQLEVEEIKKKAAKLELENLERIGNLELERNKILLEKAKIELEEVKKSNLEK